MSNTIKIEKTAAGFSAKFPFELKEQFRTAFPSAKWDSVSRCWRVGPRSGKRLEQWVAAVEASGVIAELDQRDEQILAQEELATLQDQLSEIEAGIRAERTRKASFEATKAAMQEALQQLQKARHELVDVKNQADIAASEAATARNDATEMLKQHIDLDAVISAHARMNRVAGKVGRQAKDEFTDAQQSIKRERDKLLAAGLISYGLNALVFANFNRPDRDNPRDVTMEKIMRIVGREEGDE